MDTPGRGDRPSRKFGPDAKPFKNRLNKPFKSEGSKRALKEKLGGQLYSMDDEDEDIKEVEIDDFATSLSDEEDESTS